MGFKSTIMRRSLRSGLAFWRQIFSFCACRFGNVDRGKELGDPTACDPRSAPCCPCLELPFEDEFIHARTGINQRRREKSSANRRARSCARRGEHLAGNFNRAHPRRRSSRATAAAMHVIVVNAPRARERIQQHENVLARLHKCAGNVRS